MLPDYQALSWVVLCPIAIVTNCFGVIIISHYRSSYIGTDMVLITLLLAMAANAGILLLVPAVYVMLNINWSSGLCFFYIWIFGFLRAVGLIGLFVLSFHWSHVSKLTPLNRIQTPSFPIKSSLLVTVIISVIVGILPLARILMRPDPIDENLPCMFLPYDADPTLAIFIIILTLVVFFAIIICLIDSGLLLHSYKSMFLLKYKSGGFYDTERARATWSRTGIVSDTYSEINNTFDLWRVVLLQFLLSTLINHIPYLCIEFVQLFSQNAHTEVLMLTVQWLQMMECMLFPFTLLLGARYRHAFGHICRYMFLCDRSVCEKESTCKLQSYRLKAHIQEQSLKFQENLASKNAQSHPSKSRNKNGLTILTEEERTLSSEQDTKTRVEADVHIYSTTPTRHLLSVSTPRRKQFQANINLNLEHTASTSMLPSVAVKQQHRASISPAVETLNKKQQSPSSASVSVVVHNNDDDANNYSNNSSAEGQLIASKPSSPVNSESSSPHTSELFDEDDIAEVLDRSPSPPPHPLTPPPSTPPKGYEMAVLGASIPSNIATTSTDGANAATSSSNSKKDYGSDDNNDNDGVKELPTVISLRTPMVAKAQSKHQLTAPHGDIWTSTSQCLPTAPPGISFDFHGPKPYFEPISENSSPINDDTHSKGLQSADLYKAKLPYMRSESFLQAMSSSSAYGGNPKPVAKFKLFSKVITSFSWLKNMTLQRNLPSSHSFESTDNPPNSSMFPMFGRRHKSEEEKEEEEEEEEDQSKYTLTAQPITHSRHKRVAFQQNDSPKFQMAEDNLERKSKEGNDTTADSQSAAISSATSVTSLLSQNNSDRKDHNTLTGVANLGADFTDSVFEESSAETQKDNLNTDRSDREELVDVRRKTVNDSDPRIEERRTLNRSPLHQPESTNKQHENTIVSNRKLPFLRSHLSKNTAAGDRKKNSTPNLTASQPPPVLPKCKSPPFPPPPPPPLPLSPPPPPPLSSSAAKTNPASLYKNYPCNAHSESPNQNSQFKSSTEAHFQKRPSLITTELLVTHDIIKRLRNQSEKQMESSSDNADMSAQISIYTTTTGNYLQSDEDKLVSDSVHDSLILSSSSRMYRSVSDESIFSHIGSETKEMPPSLSKATDDLTMAGFSDINRSLFWPNLKNTQQGTRSANDLHLIAYVPPIASRTIPVQKVKALQAASPERTVDNKLKYPGYETSKKLEDDDEEEVSESSSADSLKYLKILKKIEQEPDKEKVEWLRNELMDVDTLRTSPVFIRTLEKELLARKRSTEKVEKPLMASVQAVEGPEKLLPQPSLYNIDDGSPRALRKFLAEVIAKRQDIPEPGVASSHSSPFSTAPQSPTYMSSSGTDTTVNSGQAGHRTKAVVDVKTIV